VADVSWPLLGEHNVMNALAAIAAARHVGVNPARGGTGLERVSAASNAAWKFAASSTG